MADAAPKTQTKFKPPSEHENPSKLFLYKAALVTVFLVLVPLFPSLAPDFFNQTLHARSWELLQLIFVGIAVSYGLFSKRNEEPEKDGSKIDHNSQSYVSKLLQVSSVFDDESESHTVIEESSKFQALNSQYYRGEPVVVVAKENPAADEQNGVVSQISQKPKPLLLPVRSLKQRVPSPNSRRIGDFGEKEKAKEKEKEEEEKTVLRSPIPWRSRSGRMEMKVKENIDEITSNSFTSPSKKEIELNRSESRSFRANPNPNPNPNHNASKNFAPPPPAPPPPPSPAFLRKSVLMKSNSSVAATSTKKSLARSARSVPSEELSETEMDKLARFGGDNDGLVRSVRKFRVDNQLVDDKESKFFDKRGTNKNMMQTDEEDEDEESDEFDEERFAGSSTSRNVEALGDDHGRDVDKKADEFIAKFREQIRLQRIESIRRSTAQRAGKSCR